MTTYDKTNIFAKIIAGEIPCEKIYEDDKVLAFHDISAAKKVHALVIPKGEYISFNDFVQKAGPNEVASFFAKVQKVAADLDVDKTGYRLIANHGDDGHQTVPHFHMHILGGESVGPLVAGESELR